MLIQNEKVLKTNRVNLSSTSIDGTGLRFINRKEITGLDLADTNLSKAGYEQLSKLQYVKHLNLSRSNVGEAEMKLIAKMPSLVDLYLVNAKNVNDNCMEILSANRTIEVLSASYTGVTDRGLEHISNLVKLRRVDLSGNKISDVGCLKLLKCDGLVDLKVDCCREVTGKTVKAIVEKFHARLVGIGVGWCSVKREDLECLGKCPKLTYLNVAGIPITDRELKTIAGLNRLANVYFSEGKFSNEEFKKTVLKLNKLSGISALNCGLTP